MGAVFRSAENATEVADTVKKAEAAKQAAEEAAKQAAEEAAAKKAAEEAAALKAAPLKKLRLLPKKS